MRLHFILCLALFLAGCVPRADPAIRDDEPLEVIPVGEDPTTRITPDDDPRAASDSGSELQGLLPSDFPNSFPVYTPASVTDLGRGGPGQRFVELTLTLAPSGLEQWLNRQLPARGWQSAGNGRWSHSEGTVQISISNEETGTKLRVGY